jgi:protein TonB
VRKGLPYSIAIHLVALVVTVVYGAHVAAPQIEPRRVFRVRLQELPRPAEPPPEMPAAETTAEPEPAPQPPPDPEPRHVPEKPPETVKAPPEPEPEPPRPEPEEPAEEAASTVEAPTPATTAPAVSGTDEPFPFAWYLEIVRGRVTRQWNPPQVGMRDGAERTCAVHFFIERGGAVSRATIVQSSGIALLDRAGLRAVQAAHPLPPLPREFASRSLGVTFVFHLRSGL